MALSSGGNLQVLQLRKRLHWAAVVKGRMRALRVEPPLAPGERWGGRRHGEAARPQGLELQAQSVVAALHPSRPFHCGRRGGKTNSDKPRRAHSWGVFASTGILPENPCTMRLPVQSNDSLSGN